MPKASAARDEDPWFEAQVYAAMGDVARTSKTLRAKYAPKAPSARTP